MQDRQLDNDMTWEEFQHELEHLKAWVKKDTRTLRSWLYSVQQWITEAH